MQKKNKKVYKFPFARPVIKVKHATQLIKKVFSDNFPNEGKFVREFEKKISRLLNIKYVVASTSGTSALFLGLKAIGIKHGDEVIVPNITFPATANAVMLLGAKPVLTDINQDDLLINLKDLRKKVSKKTKAIIPVHISGRGRNINKILKFAKSRNIKVVEDAAEAFMSRHGNKTLGTFGHVGCFSFAPNKIITTGQGGVVVTNNKNIYEKLLKLKDQGRNRQYLGKEDKYDLVGYNFKFTNMQGALGISQLVDLKKRIQTLKSHNAIYEKNLIQNDRFKLIGFDKKNGELPLWTDAYCLDRNKLIRFLSNRGINCRYFWQPLNVCKPYLQKFTSLKNSKKINGKLFWLPSSLELKKNDIIKICKLVNAYFLKK